MPNLATYAQLRGWGQEERAKKALVEAYSFSRTGKTTFLAHSSRDDDLVAGVILILENHGARVYADHKDPSIATGGLLRIADHLRTVIGECRKFVMLATPRSKDSKWIPWELGLADGLRTNDSIALFPSAENSDETTWSQQEYLGLYNRIVWGKLQGAAKPVWFVWDHKNTGTRLEQWLDR